MVLLLFDSFFLVFECNAIQHTQIGETNQIIFNLGSLVFSLQHHTRKEKNTKKKKNWRILVVLFFRCGHLHFTVIQPLGVCCAVG